MDSHDDVDLQHSLTHPRNVRRSSEPETSLSRYNRHQTPSTSPPPTRVPLPLPYSPSDYEPSPSSPRHHYLSLDRTFWQRKLFDNASSNTRERSRSLDSHSQFALLPPSGVDTAAASTNTLSSSSSSSDNWAVEAVRSFELVPYREWTVISRNNTSGQVVLYNRESRLVTVRRQMPPEDPMATAATAAATTTTHPPNGSPIQLGECPTCHRPFSPPTARSKHDTGEPEFMDRNYFRLLASTPTQSPHTTRGSIPSSFGNNIHLNVNAFNEGYYEKFFVEKKKLGRGFRGSVFLCEHELDGVRLGKYAVKKVAVGNNHPWLVKMLREVHLLERLRHPNIVSYKHAWLEYSQPSPFGPKIPCLFILMECANGGNLEEYMEPEHVPATKPFVQQADNKKSASQLKRERIRRQQQQSTQEHTTTSTPSTYKRLLSMPEIWSLFLDIVEGLAHLHQQNIVHRDLKPPNLLLKWDTRHRDRDQPNEWRAAFDHPGIPRVLISDFGECEDLESVPDQDRTGATGTMEFMAPEHVEMDPRGRHLVEYSPKADMWSLGMVLYYLCYTKLPYTNVDDIDLLREEILAFRDVEFPKSRFDIYNDYDETMMNPGDLETLRHQDVSADIPHELKRLIRRLLSVDPEKRPSCQEILSRIANLRPSNSSSSSIGLQDIPPVNHSPSPAIDHHHHHRHPNVWGPPEYMVSTNNMVSNEPSVLDYGSSKIEPLAMDEDRPLSADDPPPPPPQPPRSQNDDRMDIDDDEDDNNDDDPTSANNTNHYPGRRGGIKKRRMSNDHQQSTTPLLLGANDPTSSSKMSIDNTGPVHKGDSILVAVKTATAIFKVASCTYPCHPYAPIPVVLYPIILMALLDFWSESVSHSLILMMMHVVWIFGMVTLYGGMCVT